VADNQRIEDLRRRVQRDPASIAFAQLAEELRRAGQFDESVDTCRAGLAVHPGYLSARVTLGRALLELNQLEAAQGELEHVLRNAPENLAAIRGLGEIHHRRGELAEALAQYRAALALARNDPELEETVAQLARQVEPPKPAIPTDGLSFDQMQSELLKLAPPPPAVPAASEARAAPPPPVIPEAADPAPLPEPASELADAADASEPPRAPTPIVDSVDFAHSADAADFPGAADSAEAADAADSTHRETLAPAVQEPVASGADFEHATRTVAALEQWLDAIHVARADRRS
jgi:tetratricopeptide (TPR) repeat protein